MNRKEYAKEWYRRNADKQREYGRNYYHSHEEERKEYQRKRYSEDPERSRSLTKSWRERHVEEIREYGKKLRSENQDSIKTSMDKWRKENENHIKEYERRYRKDNSERFKELRKKNPEYWAIRNVVHNMIMRSFCRKESQTYIYIGCTPGFLRNHIESLFSNGMKWDNYGEWHIDHIVPLSWWDLKNNPEHLYIASHWTNLQPLWKKENLSKGDRKI